MNERSKNRFSRERYGFHSSFFLGGGALFSALSIYLPNSLRGRANHENLHASGAKDDAAVVAGAPGQKGGRVRKGREGKGGWREKGVHGIIMG